MSPPFVLVRLGEGPRILSHVPPFVLVPLEARPQSHGTMTCLKGPACAVGRFQRGALVGLRAKRLSVFNEHPAFGGRAYSNSNHLLGTALSEHCRHANISRRALSDVPSLCARRVWSKSVVCPLPSRSQDNVVSN